jgi:hypothetical protein
MPAPPHPALASHLWTGLVRRAQRIGTTFVQTWHQARPGPPKRQLPPFQQARKGAAAPVPQHTETPYNPLYDLPALPPFRSAEASLGTGPRAIPLSAQASATLDATLQRLRQVLAASQRRPPTAEQLVEACLLMSAADVQAHGADSQIVEILGRQLTAQPAPQASGEDPG